MAQRDPAKLKKVSVSLPFGIGKAEWEADPTERSAAWALYVELVTRIAVQPLGEREGTLREALTSLHSLFSTTRSILREAGPDVARSQESVGHIAIRVLNQGLRPFLSHWHPGLQHWEGKNVSGSSPQEHEKAWDDEARFRKDLTKLQSDLEQYAAALATIAGVEHS